MSSQPLSPEQIRRAPKDGGPSFGMGNRLVRLAWMLTWFSLAAWTPTPLHAWRRFLLRLFGARMGERSDVRGSARVWLPSNLVMEAHAVIGPGVNCYNQATIHLGRWALVSQGAHLCAGTHDIDREDFPLIARPIHIGAHSWIAAEAFVGPGAQVAEGVVLGARAVLFGRTEAWGVYAGNPARFIRERRWRSAGGA